MTNARAAGIGTAFHYQGSLRDGSSPAQGTYDFRFALYDQATGGLQIGSALTNQAVAVDAGVFTVLLDFGASFDQARWLEIGVRTHGSAADFTALDPRQAATPAPYSIVASQLAGPLPSALLSGKYTSPVAISNAANLFTGAFSGNGAGLTGLNASQLTAGTVDNARLAPNVALLNRSQQTFIGNNAFSENLGIGTTTPSQKLHAVSGASPEVRIENSGSGTAALGLVNADREYSVRMTTSEKLVLRDVTAGNVDRLIITTNGNVGIGTGAPRQALHVAGDYYGKGHFYLYAYEGEGSDGTAYVQARDEFGSSSIGLKFRTQNNGSIVETMQLGTDGVTYVNVLTITGGTDIAEPFPIHHDEDIEPGMVVSIDPNRAGELRLSTRAYDPAVAGIVSGAGGVNPGMTLRQTGTIADGNHPVALTGRVWCNVDAGFAPVKPGDLLATSDTPGHAMKALDPGRSQGAVLGKAMTRLEQGRGLVLVLVSLQ